MSKSTDLTKSDSIENFILDNSKIGISINGNGFYNVYSKKYDQIYLMNAFPSAEVNGKTISALSNNENVSPKIHSYQCDGVLGSGKKIIIEYEKSELNLIFKTEISRYNSGEITFETILTNNSSDMIELGSLSVLQVDKEFKGGLFLEKTPEDAIIFENGLGSAFEFCLRSFNAREESDSSGMEFIYSKHNFSKNILFGLLSLIDYLSEVTTNEDYDDGLKINGDTNINVEGIAQFSAKITFPFPKKVSPGDSISTGVWILMIDSDGGFEALESYADLIAKYNQIKLWPGVIPHGWNSWNNPLKGWEEYSYSTRVNEQIILENMELAIKYLKPYDLQYWQLDSGYTPQDVMTLDDIMEDRYPHGMKYIADKIHEQDLKAGIWVNPFNIGINSRLYKEKTALAKDKSDPNWFPEPDPSFPVKDSKWRSLDTSIPEVQNYIKRAVHKAVNEWGYDLLKIDFAYMNMAPKKFHNPYLTAPEIHRLGFKLIKEAAGNDKFLFGIGGPIYLHMGLLHGERISLDTMPVWNDPKVPPFMFELPQTMGTVTYNYRNWARRYFYNNRVWYNHLDCLSFRPSLTRNESMCMMTAAALLGGIFKIGDKLVDMKREDFEVYQKMLPIHKFTVRPLDLFEKIMPELIHVPIEIKNKNSESKNKTGLNDGLKFDVVGLFNWGENKDLIGEQNIPEEDREIVLEFSRLGYETAAKEDDSLNSEHNEPKFHVFDFWNQEYVGLFSKKYTVKLKPRTHQLISLHRLSNIPQFIGSNRHVTQGGIEIINYEVDEKAKSEIVIKIKIHALPPDLSQTLHFYVPSSYKFEKELGEYKLNDAGASRNYRIEFKPTCKDVNVYNVQDNEPNNLPASVNANNGSILSAEVTVRALTGKNDSINHNISFNNTIELILPFNRS